MKSKSILSVGLFCLITSAASAGNFSFQGTFLNDDQVQLFSFTLGTTGPVTLRTYGYAGGTNAAGNVILAGGFDPLLVLYDSTGANLGTFDDGGCSHVGTGAGGCLDSFDLESSLGAGTYTLALAESPNEPVGSLSDGFTGGGGCGTTPFCDAFGNQQNGAFAVDILSVDSAFAESSSASVPEPGSMLLMVSGVGLLPWVKRRIAFSASEIRIK